MSILFGLLSLIVSIVVPILILIFTGFEVMHFSLFFIVPVGAGFVGYVCGYGYYKGLFKSNTFITRKHYLVGIVASLICIFGIMYTTYKLTCINPETQKITYALEGNHISNYAVDGYGELDFLTYNKYMIENTPISFSYKTRSIGDVSSPTWGWIFAIIDFLGVIAGGLIAGSSQKENSYCHGCKLYKKQKEILRVPKAEGVEFFKKLEESLSIGDMGEAMNDLLSKYTLDKSVAKQAHYLCKLQYCENCKSASLVFELYELKSKGALDKNTDFNYKIDVNLDYLRRFIDKSSVPQYS